MQLNALLCDSSQETLQSSSRSTLKKKPCSHQRIAFLLLLTSCMSGTFVCAISGGQQTFEETSLNIWSQNQQQEKGGLPQLQQQKQQQLQWSCAATPWVVLSGGETTSRRVLVSEGAYFVPNATVSLTGPTEHGGDCKARQPVEAAAAPAASDTQEEEAIPQSGGRLTRSSQDAVVTTTGVVTFYTEQLHEQHERQEQTLQQQQVHTPQTNSETPGFFSRFKGLEGTADANAIVAWGKGLNATLNSGPFKSKPSRQKQHLQRLQHSLLFPSPYSFAASTSSEHSRYILADAATEAASEGTEAPPRREGHEGAEIMLSAKLQQRRHNLHGLVPTAACSWGLSAMWLIQWCYSLRTSIVPAAIATTSTEQGTASAASVARCSCVSSHMPVLLRSDPLWQQEQQHQQREQREVAARLVPVLQQRTLLLCCTEGSPASQGKQQLQLRSVFSRGDTEEHTGAVASAPAVAALFEETQAHSRQTEPVTASADEASPPRGTMDAAGAAGFSEPIPVPGSDSHVKSLPSASGGGQQQAELRKEQAEYMGAFSGSNEARREQGQKFKAQEELQGKMQRSEQEGDQKHLELFSRWGGQLVSWTWRRSCMRQRQSPRPEVAVTESSGVAAAAHCYRPHTSTSLALQLLLLLLPRDMVLRLLADRDLMHCQQPLPQQQRAQKEQSQSCKKQVDLPRVSVSSPAARTASKMGSCTASMVHSNGDFKSRETCDARLSNGGSSYALKAVRMAGSHGHEHQLDPLKLSKFYGDVPSQQSSGDPYSQLVPRQQFLQNESQRNTDTSTASQQEEERWQKLQEQQNAAPQEQRQQEQQQQQLRESEVQEKQDSHSAASLATATVKQHTYVDAQGASSAVGGVPGTPRLYGRGFVQGGQLPASFLRLHFNFASLDAGARIIASSGGMQHIKAVQVRLLREKQLAPAYLLDIKVRLCPSTWVLCKVKYSPRTNRQTSSRVPGKALRWHFVNTVGMGAA